MDPAIVVAVVALLGSLLSAAISIYWQVPSSSMSPAFRRSVVRSLGVLPGDRVSRGWRSNVTATGRRPRSRATLDRAPDDGLVSSVHAIEEPDRCRRFTLDRQRPRSVQDLHRGRGYRMLRWALDNA
jgi:hypothetical protein